jgi:hypothetical protein
MSFTAGVGSRVGGEEHAVALVGGTDVRCSEAAPLRVVPERGQVAEYDVEPAGSEEGDVLHDDESGS